MKLGNNLPELARHELAIDYATGNFTLKVVDYAQADILKNFVVSREYNSRTGIWKFNIDGRSPKITLKTLREIFFTYADKNLVAVRDGIGRLTRYEYDENFLSRVIYPDSSRAEYHFEDEKNLTTCIGRGGKILFQNEYDELGRLIKLSDEDGTRNFFYDDKNQRTVESGRNEVVYKWNRRKQIESVIYADGTAEKFLYDADGRLNYKSERNGDEYFWRYNGGLLTREVFPDGLIKKFDYDARGNLIRQTDSNGREEVFVYSSKNLLIERRVRLNVKDWRCESWEYDVAGRALKHDINGQITRFAYDDEAPAPALMMTPCGYKFSFFYDRIYRLLTMRAAVGEFRFAHTVMNEVIAERKNIFEQIFAPEKIPVQADIKIFDTAGRLIEARKKIGDQFKLTRWKYDLNDNCIERRDWLDLQSSQSATGRVATVNYAYDAQNRLIVRSDDKTLTRYGYDCLNHVTFERKENFNGRQR